MSNDVADIRKLGYDYPPFDYKKLEINSKDTKSEIIAARGAPPREKIENSKRELKITGINIMNFNGPFKIKVVAITSSNNRYDLGTQAVFVAGNTTDCDNCAVNSLIERNFSLKQVHINDEQNLRFSIRFKLSNDGELKIKRNLIQGHTETVNSFGITIQLSY